MFFKRKIFINSLSIMATTIPTVMAISCYEDNNADKNKIPPDLNSVSKNNFAHFDFNDIDKNEPEFLTGVQYTAYSQGFSFVMNLARELGWNWEDSNKLKNLYDPDFDFNKSVDVTKNRESKFKNNNRRKGIESNLVVLATKDNSLGRSMLEKLKIKTLNSYLWHYIHKFEWADPNESEIVDNIDALSEVVIDLNKGYDKLFEHLQSGEQINRILHLLNEKSINIFKNLNYAYNWSGKEVKNLAFQIIEDKELLVWHYAPGDNLEESLSKIKNDRNKILDLGKNIKKNFHNESDFSNGDFPTDYSIQQTKNLSQIWLDPVGAHGTLGVAPFLLAINSKLNTKYKYSFFKSYDNHFANRYFNVWYFYTFKNGKWDFTGNGRKNGWKDKEKIFQIISYNSFIDGREPGKVIFKGFIGKDKTFFNMLYYPLKVIKSPKIIQNFYTISNERKKKELSNLIFAFFQNIKKSMNSKNQNNTIRLLKSKISPVSSSLLHFLEHKDLKKTDIDKAFNNLNNGSHYMLAIEMFLRGIKNIPDDNINNLQIPPVFGSLPGVNLFPIKKDKNTNLNTIEGMSNTSDISNLVNFMYNIANNNKIGNFNPKTKKIQINENHIEGDRLIELLKDKTNEMSKGKEITTKT